MVTLSELHVPVGRPVYLKLRSKDVVHSLYLPNFRTKIDAIPGSTTRLWFQAQEPGRFEIGCAQHCGVSHYKMRGWLIAAPEDEYRGWLARAETDSRLRYDPADVRRALDGLGLGDGPVTAPATPTPTPAATSPTTPTPSTLRRRLPGVSRVFSTDHKVIGKQFLFLGLVFLAVGGVMAMLIRWQLARPGQPVPLVGRLLFARLRRRRSRRRRTRRCSRCTARS